MADRPRTFTAGTTLNEAITTGQAAGVARLDLQLMLAHLFHASRTWFVAHDDQALSAEQAFCLTGWLARRIQGEPLAYLVGQKEFFGLNLNVSNAVLVPRPETELLVEWALEALEARIGSTPSASAQVIDLGTGSGAIALALKHSQPRAQLTAVDASAEALAVARRNGEALGVEVSWQLSDWYEAVAGQRFDLIVSNPPYIAGSDHHLDALRHEPIAALTPGGDGLDALRRIVVQAPAHLASGGWLLMEHGYDQAAAVRQLLQERGFHRISTRLDANGHERCTGGHVD